LAVAEHGRGMEIDPHAGPPWVESGAPAGGRIHQRLTGCLRRRGRLALNHDTGKAEYHDGAERGRRGEGAARGGDGAGRG
jgi:hypothetical protein